MADKIYTTLFICTGNSARSILAESLLNHLGHGRFRAFSAGSQPRGEVHPLTLATLEQLKLPTDGLRSKGWEAFATPDSPPLDFVVTVCDQAAGEACPVWPGLPVTAHWELPDPVAVTGTPEHRQQAFLDAALTLKRRIELMLALPLTTLEKMALQDEVRDIGRQ